MTGFVLFRLHPVSTAPLTTALQRDRHCASKHKAMIRSHSNFCINTGRVLRLNVRRRVCRVARVREQ